MRHIRKEIEKVQENVYGFSKYYGKPVRIKYLPTKRSKKWRNAFSCPCFSESNKNYLFKLKDQESWAGVKVEEL